MLTPAKVFRFNTAVFGLLNDFKLDEAFSLKGNENVEFSLTAPRSS